MAKNRIRSARGMLIAAILAVITGPPALAQQFAPNNEFGVWGAFSANSPDVYTSQGHIQFGVAAFRYGRLLHKSHSYTVEYTQWQPFAAFSGGFVMSQNAIPDDIPKATRFNFTGDIQLGMEHFNRTRTRAWIFSYKLQHISNGFRSSINPGVDLNMLAVGYSFFK